MKLLKFVNLLAGTFVDCIVLHLLMVWDPDMNLSATRKFAQAFKNDLEQLFPIE